MLVAIDIGGTKTGLMLAVSAQRITTQTSFPTPHDPAQFLPTLHTELNRLLPHSTIRAVGVAAKGPIEKTNGSWQGIPVVAELTKRYQCPVVFEHDATAGGIAEARLGAGSDHKLLLYVTISTGIGSAIIMNGQPLPSPYNSEGGHQVIQNHPFPGKRLEQLVSGQAIVHRFGKIAAEIDDVKTWQLIAQDLAIGLYNMISIVQPAGVVLAGGVSTHYDRFEKFLKQSLTELKPQYPLPPIKQARFVETAPAIGALILAGEAVS